MRPISFRPPRHSPRRRRARWRLGRATAATALVIATGVSACATVPSARRSWVEPAANRPGSAAPLAAAIASFVGERLPAARSMLVLVPPPDAQRANAVTAAVSDALRHAGFALAPEGVTPPGAHRVRYLVTPLLDGILMRVQVDQLEAARFFRPDERGTFVAAAPLTVREAP